MLRPYAPNNSPRNYGIVQGVARLLENIWQPGAQYRKEYAAWGLYEHEAGRAVVGLLPSPDEALATYVRTQPQHAPERVQSFDALRFVDTSEEALALIEGGETAYEVARIDVQHGLCVLESVETWARLEALDSDGNAIGIFELLPYTPGPVIQVGTPCPFPINHPEGGEPAVSIEWVLVFDRGSQRQRAADLLGPAELARVPVTAGTPAYWPHVWADQRYPWNSDAPYPQKWSTSGPGSIRLFAKVLTGSRVGGNAPAWNFKIAGRLRGYQQPAGPSGAAFRNVTLRH